MNENLSLADLARRAVAAGRADLAEAYYRELLEQVPEHVEALAYTGMRLLQRGAPAQALGPLRRAQALRTDDPHINENLGVALLRCDDLEGAGRHLHAALQADPKLHRARLMLGKLLERNGETRAAAAEYHRALTAAQRLGIWLSNETTPSALRKDVLHAVDFAQRYRRGLIEEVLAPLRARHGASGLMRIDACMASYLGERTAEPADARQRPKKLFVPGLPTSPYLETHTLPWLDTLRSTFASIREELSALRQASPDAFRPFLTFTHEEQAQRHLRNHGNAPAVWDAYFFYRHGLRHDDNHARCPQTSTALEACPLNHVRGQAPEICFSVLTPGTHILPHHGDTNARVVVHLPLIVPAKCMLNVGGESHTWREGEPVVFDDTFEHEAWNHGESDRIVLILDAWNPYLSDAERESLTALIPVLGDFDRICQSAG